MAINDKIRKKIDETNKVACHGYSFLMIPPEQVR